MTQHSVLSNSSSWPYPTAHLNLHSNLEMGLPIFTEPPSLCFYLEATELEKHDLNLPQARVEGGLQAFPNQVEPLIGLVRILDVISEIAMSAKGTLPAVHGEEATGPLGRSQHQYVVPMPSCPQMSSPPHGLWRHSRQELPRRFRQNLQWILCAHLTAYQRWKVLIRSFGE